MKLKVVKRQFKRELRKRGLKILSVEGTTFRVRANPKFYRLRMGPFIAISEEDDAIEADWARLRWP